MLAIVDVTARTNALTTGDIDAMDRVDIKTAHLLARNPKVEIVVMLQGEKEEVLTPPHHDYTDLLLSSVPEMDPDWLENLLQRRQAAS